MYADDGNIMVIKHKLIKQKSRTSINHIKINIQWSIEL